MLIMLFVRKCLQNVFNYYSIKFNSVFFSIFEHVLSVTGKLPPRRIAPQNIQSWVRVRGWFRDVRGNLTGRNLLM